MKIPAFLAREKFRFDLGQGFLAIVNFAFVVIAASDKLATLVHLSARVTVLVLVPLAVFAVWLLGFILDKLQFSQAYQHEQNHRNEMLRSLHSSAGVVRAEEQWKMPLHAHRHESYERMCEWFEHAILKRRGFIDGDGI